MLIKDRLLAAVLVAHIMLVYCRSLLSMFKRVLANVGAIIGAAVRKLVLLCVHALGVIFGYCVSIQPGSCRRLVKANLKLCFPSLSDKQIQQLTFKNVQETCKLSLEVLLLWLCSKYFIKHIVVKVEGEQAVEQALQAGKSVVIACPHLGNWEVFNCYIGKYTPYVLYKPLESSRANNFVRSGRERNGSNLLPTSKQGVKTLFSGIKQGGVAMILPDQVPDAGRVKVPFFGVPAWTGTLVPKLASKPNVELFFGFAQRLPAGKGFLVYFRAAADEAYSQDLYAATLAMNKGIEDCVRVCPEQYNWAYKRFKETELAHLYLRPTPRR